MGIHGLFQEIGRGQRIALAKLAIDHLANTGRPLRIAIDTSIWLFQIQSGKGGTNPALRTFYFRLLRLMSLGIHPLFIFDGLHKPKEKRNKKSASGVASIPDHFAKEMLDHFGFPYHVAPGEAEAECALFQKQGIVDAVLTEDVDTLMFGCGTTICKWSADEKIPEGIRVSVYDAAETQRGSGLSPEGMILVALMSGGDYDTEGITGCGPKVACEAARAGFGADLCKISRRDKEALKAWRERLAHELKTNESKFFKRKHKALTIPEGFPDTRILGYYTQPVISSAEKLAELRNSFVWDKKVNFERLREFTASCFKWTHRKGAKWFVKNLAPALLVRELRLNGQMKRDLMHDIHGMRNHASIDGLTQLNISYTPGHVVPIDVEGEPEEEVYIDESDEEPEGALENEAGKKKRTVKEFDPAQPAKYWMFEEVVKIGALEKLNEWEEEQERKRQKVAEKARRAAERRDANVAKAISKSIDRNMPHNAMHRYTKITKPTTSATTATATATASNSNAETSIQAQSHLEQQRRPFRAPPKPTLQVPEDEVISLLSSPAATAPQHHPPQIVARASRANSAFRSKPASFASAKRTRSPLRRANTDTSLIQTTLTDFRPSTPPLPRIPSLPSLSSPQNAPSSTPRPTPKQKRPRPLTNDSPISRYLGTIPRPNQTTAQARTPSRPRTRPVPPASPASSDCTLTDFLMPGGGVAGGHVETGGGEGQRTEMNSPSRRGEIGCGNGGGVTAAAVARDQGSVHSISLFADAASSSFGLDVEEIDLSSQVGFGPPSSGNMALRQVSGNARASFGSRGLKDGGATLRNNGGAVGVTQRKNPKTKGSRNSPKDTRNTPANASLDSVYPVSKAMTVSLKADGGAARKGQYIRVRDSVPGTFAMESESVNDVTAFNGGKEYRLSNVEVLDLS